MKALLYKEFKLAVHPLCYIFIFAFPFMILIPKYPIAISFIYVLSCYPIMFLGANKGQQSNDLLYSTLLPIRKKDIVLARILTICILHFIFIATTTALWPLASLIQSSIQAVAGEEYGGIPGLTLNGYISTVGIALVGFGLADLIFFPIFYKKGKSIVLSTLLTILFFVIYIGITTILIPYLPGCEWYVNILCNSGIGIQFGVLGIGLLIYFAIHVAVYFISSKLLEKVDF